MGELTVILGRRPEAMIGKYDLGRVALPSGAMNDDVRHPATRELPKTGPGASMWREMLRYKAGGLVDLDPDTIVAALAPAMPAAGNPIIRPRRRASRSIGMTRSV